MTTMTQPTFYPLQMTSLPAVKDALRLMAKHDESFGPFTLGALHDRAQDAGLTGEDLITWVVNAALGFLPASASEAVSAARDRLNPLLDTIRGRQPDAMAALTDSTAEYERELRETRAAMARQSIVTDGLSSAIYKAEQEFAADKTLYGVPARVADNSYRIYRSHGRADLISGFDLPAANKMEGVNTYYAYLPYAPPEDDDITVLVRVPFGVETRRIRIENREKIGARWLVTGPAVSQSLLSENRLRRRENARRLAAMAAGYSFDKIDDDES